VKAPDARGVAHEVLVRVETTAAFADVLLARRLAATSLSPADRALATELVYGTLAWQGRLDHHLTQLVHGSLAELDPPVRAALRIGLHQLLFLDRIPAYAAVDASVRLARRGGGLVNAVLRRAARLGRDGLALPDGAADPVGRLAVEWSHPRWLVERLAEEIGTAELPALLAAHNVRGPVALRATASPADALAAELSAHEARIAPGRWAPEALLVARQGARLRACDAYRTGRFVFQGEPSQLVTRLLGIAPGSAVLDACAAPGGKTLHAAALAGPHGLVVALDPHRAGVRRIAAEAARLGASIVHPVVADARRPPLHRAFDAVLVDAPCSGLGTLRRHPELRWRRLPEDLTRLAALQGDLLAAVAPLVRAGGVLVYAVCSPLRAETDEVIAGFLATSPRFMREPAQPCLPAAAAPLVSSDGALRTWPHHHDVDAFFAVRLRAR
jgi:16S rRNA (cytosine967-C5)-methyltransferase